MEVLDLYPLPVLVIDYILGSIMWTLLGRAVLDLFIPPESKMVIAVAFRTLTDPVIKIFRKITPSFLVPFLIPVYVAWWFYLVRFYLIPLIFIGRFGMLSFSLERFLFG